MSEPQAQPAGQPAPVDIERANLYALTARLFYAAPDADLIAQIRESVQAEGGGEDAAALRAGWRALQDACGSAIPEVIRQEYDDLFVGVGRAQVTPYLSGYAEPSSPDRYLVRLREQLSRWGLVRRSSAFEIEDHISALSDVMRLVIEHGRPLEEQQEFFAHFVYPGAGPFFIAVKRAPSASFYKVVAVFAHAFFELEKEAFEMWDRA